MVDHASPHDLTGAYVLDALPAGERHCFEAHLTICGRCRIEVVALREAVVELAGTQTVSPGADLRERVLGAAATTPQEPPQRARSTSRPR